MFHPSKYSLAHGTSGVSAGTTFSWASSSWGPRWGAQPAAPCNWDRGVRCPSFFPSAPGLHCSHCRKMNIQNVEKCLSHPLIDWSAHLITHLVVQPSCAHLLIHTHMMSFIYLFIRKWRWNIISLCSNTFWCNPQKTTVYWFLLSSVLPHVESFAWLGGGSFSILALYRLHRCSCCLSTKIRAARMGSKTGGLPRRKLIMPFFDGWTSICTLVDFILHILYIYNYMYIYSQDW